MDKPRTPTLAQILKAAAVLAGADTDTLTLRTGILRSRLARLLNGSAAANEDEAERILKATGCDRSLLTKHVEGSGSHGLLAALEADEPVNMLSADELGRFLAALKLRWPQWYALVFTQFATARRFGEVSALKWDDINQERNIITIRRAQWRTMISTPKTDRLVTVPLTDELRAVLDEWRQTMLCAQHRHVHTGWIFPSKVGEPHHNASCMRKAFIDCLNQSGIGRGFSSHGLRRTANNLLRQVASGEVTRAITGHVTVAMTEHYSHVAASEKHAAMDKVLKLVQPPRAC